MRQNKTNILFNIIGIAILLFSCLIGIVYIIFTLSMTTAPTSTVLNKNDTFLNVGDVWTVDNQFSIWIDNIEEVSSDVVQTNYPEIENISGKKYFDITFSFQNINFSGCSCGENILCDYLTLKTSVMALNNHKQVIPSIVKKYSQDSYGTAVINGTEIPVMSGITSTNNHFFFEIDSSSEDIEFLAIRFIVPVETLSAEATVQYRRDYLISFPYF